MIRAFPFIPATDIDAFHLHVAALEWSVVDPIIINNKKEKEGTLVKIQKT